MNSFKQNTIEKRYPEHAGGCRKKVTPPKLRHITYTDLERLCLNIWWIGRQSWACPICFHLILLSWGDNCTVLWVLIRMRSKTCNGRPQKCVRKNPKGNQRCIICRPSYLRNIGSIYGKLTECHWRRFRRHRWETRNLLSPILTIPHKNKKKKSTGL